MLKLTIINLYQVLCWLMQDLFLTNELQLLIKMQEADIVCIMETWLKDTIPDEEIDCLGTNLCIHDRVNGAGGGVVIFINTMIPFKVRQDLGSLSFECIWVTIRPVWLPRELSRICICCVYLPPNQSDIERFYDYFYECYDKLCLKSPNSAFIGPFHLISAPPY